MKSVKKLLALLFFIFLAVSVQAQESGGHVLVLHSYHRGLEWTDSIMQGIEAEFAKQAIRPEIHVEYMDTKRHLPATVFPTLHDLYVKKYGKTQPELIIVSDDNAYEFILTFREELFPGVPVVFCGVNYFDPARLAGSQGITGIVEGVDILGTLEAALRLHSETERIFVINDTTTTGQANKQVVKEIIPRFSERIDFNFLEALSMEELQGALQTLPPKSLVLLLSFNRDRAGRTFTYQEAIRQIAPHNKAPMYGVWEFYLGRGIVGGKLTRGLDHGRAAATMGLSILRGEAAENIPVVFEGINSFMFDYPVLRKFGIDIEQLPPGSIVANKPESFYHRNKGLVLAVGGVIAALTLLALFLTLNIIKRKRAEENLRESEERFRQVAMTNWVWEIDLEGRYTYCSENVIDTLGYSREEIIGKTPFDFMSQEEASRVGEIFAELIASRKRIIDLENWNVTQNGSEICLLTNGAPFYDKSGNLIGYRGGDKDITDRKRAELELVKHQDQLELLVEDRTLKLKEAQAELIQGERLATLGSLTATVSHELRNPLGTIRTALFSIEDSLERNDSSLVARTLELADRSISRCVTIIEELNSYARVKDLDISETSVDDWLRAVFKEQSIPEEISYALDLSSDVRASFDHEKLRQVVVNLIANAVHALQDKQSNGKHLRVSTHLLDDKYEIRISDNGIGMTSDIKEKVFEPLFSTKGFGVGLGMVIVKNIVDQHHGEINIQSKEGEGTTVTLRLPINFSGERKNQTI
jgi:PAS domain S-box-containing protein